MSVDQDEFVIDIGHLPATADLSGKQFFAVKLDAVGGVVIASSQGEKVFGILQNKPTAGQPAHVRTLGVTKWSSDAAITAGAEVTVQSDGQVMTSASSDNIAGQAIDGAGGADELPSIYFMGFRGTTA